MAGNLACTIGVADLHHILESAMLVRSDLLERLHHFLAYYGVRCGLSPASSKCPEDERVYIAHLDIGGFTTCTACGDMRAAAIT